MFYICFAMVGFLIAILEQNTSSFVCCQQYSNSSWSLLVASKVLIGQPQSIPRSNTDRRRATAFVDRVGPPCAAHQKVDTRLIDAITVLTRLHNRGRGHAGSIRKACKAWYNLVNPNLIHVEINDIRDKYPQMFAVETIRIQK